MFKYYRQSGKSRWKAISRGLVLLFAQLLVSACQADVVVLQNLTGSEIKLTVYGDDSVEDAQLDVNASRPFFDHTNPRVVIGNTRSSVGKVREDIRLLANAAYEISVLGGKFRLRKVPLGGNEFTLKSNPQFKPTAGNQPEEQDIAVSLWVDEELPLLQRDWEPKYRERFERAAKIIEAHSGVRFRVESAGRWNSNNGIRSFSGSLFEFIDKVNPCRNVGRRVLASTLTVRSQCQSSHCRHPKATRPSHSGSRVAGRLGRRTRGVAGA